MAATATFFYEGRIKGSADVVDDGMSEALTIVFDRGQVMRPIEEALRVMNPGEERVIDVLAEDAFGTYDEKAVERVLVKDVPNGENLPVGEYISWRNPVSERPLPVKVVSVRNGIAEFDFNHPLAGKDLVYRVRLVERSGEAAN